MEFGSGGWLVTRLCLRPQGQDSDRHEGGQRQRRLGLEGLFGSTRLMKVRDERRQGQERVRLALQGGMCVLHSRPPPLAFSVLRTATLARQGLSAAV